MYMDLMRAGSAVVAAGGVFVVSSAFSGGAIPVPAGLSEVKANAYIRAYQIYNSSELGTLRSAAASGEATEIRGAGLSVVYEPTMPALEGYAGMALHNPEGFALGPRAFESETDLSETIL
jgi:hypothetical protein